MTSTPPNAFSTPIPSSPQGSAVQPPAPVVSILPNQIAQTYSLIHPALLLTVLAVRFQALVADPVAELLNALPLLVLLQVAYVMVCLPPAGSPLPSSKNVPGSSEASSSAGDGDEKKKTGSSGSGAGAAGVVLRPGKVGYRRKNHHHSKFDSAAISAKLTPALLSLIISFLLATPVLAVLLILFGAPLTTHNFETVLCAAHMAILSSTALVYVHGVDGATWREVWGFARPADAVWGGALGTGLGAWFGAVPIPLDWDRPWQAFPITILTGAYIGYAVGSLVSRLPWLYGKRLQFTPEEPEESQKTD